MMYSMCCMYTRHTYYIYDTFFLLVRKISKNPQRVELNSVLLSFIREICLKPPTQPEIRGKSIGPNRHLVQFSWRRGAARGGMNVTVKVAWRACLLFCHGC